MASLLTSAARISVAAVAFATTAWLAARIATAVVAAAIAFASTAQQSAKHFSLLGFDLAQQLQDGATTWLAAWITCGFTSTAWCSIAAVVFTTTAWCFIAAIVFATTAWSSVAAGVTAVVFATAAWTTQFA
jgi:hypothetical protein